MEIVYGVSIVIVYDILNIVIVNDISISKPFWENWLYGSMAFSPARRRSHDRPFS